MNWLAVIIVMTTGGVKYTQLIPTHSAVECESAVTEYVENYDAARAMYMHECINIGAIVNGEAQ